MVRAQAPISVVSLQNLLKLNELVDGYIRPFLGKVLPLDVALSQNAIQNVLQAKSARERLLKAGEGHHGVSGQLTSSLAHSSNPKTLAASLKSSGLGMGGGGGMCGMASGGIAGAGEASNFSRMRPKSRTGHGAGGHLKSDSNYYVANDLEKAALDPALALYLHARSHG